MSKKHIMKIRDLCKMLNAAKPQPEVRRQKPE